MNKATYAYDELNRLIQILYPDSSSVSYFYDARGRKTRMVDSHGTTSYAYDLLGRLTGVVRLQGRK